MRKRTYSECMQYETFGDRLKYLQLYDDKYISPRAISNTFYKNNLWLITRDIIITRDAGLDLATKNCSIDGDILVHHIIPITEEDIDNDSDLLYDPENLITTCIPTHNIIHYKPKLEAFVERRPGDTTLWKTS